MKYVLHAQDDKVDLVYKKSEGIDHIQIIAAKSKDGCRYIDRRGEISELAFLLLQDDRNQYTPSDFFAMKNILLDPRRVHLHDWVLRDVSAEYHDMGIVVINSGIHVMYYDGDSRVIQEDDKDLFLHNFPVPRSLTRRLEEGASLIDADFTNILDNPKRITHAYRQAGYAERT